MSPNKCDTCKFVFKLITQNIKNTVLVTMECLHSSIVYLIEGFQAVMLGTRTIKAAKPIFIFCKRVSSYILVGSTVLAIIYYGYNFVTSVKFIT